MIVFSKGLRDFTDTIKALPLSFFFAWGDTKARYRRSFLGPFWLVIGTAIGVAGLGFLWSQLLNVEKSVFIPSLCIGLVIWQLISGCIMEAPSIMVQNARLIKNIKTPFLFFPLQLLLRQMINFAHNLLVVVAVLLIFPPSINFSQILIIPGIVLVVGNLFWISALISLISARYRDVGPLITSFMPLMFFLTPVIYRPSQLAMSEYIAWMNPLTYLITLIRDPIEGLTPSLYVYVVSMVSLIFGTALTVIFLGKKYNRIAFWV
ncbi:ABC transporter permease [Neorhizobium sp. T786]|uniref:ABC transporter permease n=1 Tax=Pseudorhizobium xiangyangii TaxID=2883104 RepID=UPI001CFFF7E2|nr:ABC transporter permease [Neorhizobium xiangyangii]MCB5202607.1 ABC transporter permease [Neorhizobium xiangyangii]